MELRILGPLEIVDQDHRVRFGSLKQRTLLAALLVNAGNVVSSDRLIDILWGDEPPATAPATLQGYVSRLRQALTCSDGTPSPVLANRAPGYVLQVEPGQFDAACFEALLSEARELRDRQPAGALALLDEALALWRGPALAEFADAEFARAEATRLEGLRLAAMGDRIDLRLASGQHAELVGELEALVASHPLQEQPRAQLMLALYRAGRQVEALRAFQEYRTFLATEMGLEPSAALHDLENRMVRQDPDLDAGARVVSEPIREQLPEVSPSSEPATTSIPTLRAVTFLCTDIEGSTRLWEEHPDAMRAALARHDRILGDAVEEHGGRIFKTTGDGAYATLPAVSDAVGAAVQAMRALSSETWGPTGPLSVRMAIHTGQVEERDGDFFGPALNRTSRVMGAAHGGQVVLTSASASLMRDGLPDGLELADLGLHRLRGIARPERVYQLQIAGLRSAFPPLQSIDAFPGSLPAVRPSFARAAEEFAGRQAELDSLERAWRRAGEGVRRVVLVAGEPGIGKTRLMGELANLVYAEDAAVLYGRCDEDAVVPYQPFVEALQPYVAAYPSPVLHERLHGLEQDLTRLFPELRGRILERPSPTVSDPEAERYRLFEAITSLLTGVAAAGPALLVLDDLHWADRPTLQLLRHVVRSASDAALLVVVCYRDVELPQGHEVANLLADLRREPFTEDVALEGLSEAEAGTLLRGVAGHEVAPALTRALHREAGGSPFFLAELLRSLMETNPALVAGAEDAREVDLGALGLPQSVRDVVARRVRRLPSPVNDVLGLASVVGPEFGVSLLARAGEWPAGEVLEALDQAKDAGLVDEQSSVAGRYSFSHDLIRQALYVDLGTARKAQLHARVGAAMEQEAGVEHSAAELAEHFMQAVVLGEAPRALQYTTAAARDAAAHLALEDAAGYFEQALDLLDRHSPADTVQRVELLIDLAEVLIFVDESAGVHAALRAVDAARANGSPEQFGRAVAVFAPSASANPDQAVALLNEAQQVLGDDHRSLRARLMAIEAFKYSAYQLQGRDGRALADRAVHLARDAADTPTLTAALFARAISLESTAHTTERRALGEELVGLGRAGGTRAAMATVQGLRVLAGVHLELGEAESLNSTISEFARVSEELRWLPALVFEAQWRATQALLEGRFDDARGCGNDMRRYARAYRAVVGMEAQQTYYLAREEGDLADLVGPLEQISASSPGSLYVPAMLALAQLDSGEEMAARHTLNSITADDLHRAAQENAWQAVLALFAEVAASAEPTLHAELLDELLTPFSGRLLAAVIGLACLGAADRYLGMLSTTLERWDDAEAYFERALDLERRIRGRALLPRTRYWQAQFLRARARPGDDLTARALLGGVVEVATELGMRRLREQAEHRLAG